MYFFEKTLDPINVELQSFNEAYLDFRSYNRIEASSLESNKRFKI